MKFGIAHGLLEPQRRAKVHDIEHDLDSELLELGEALVGDAPVELAAPGLDLVPWQRIAKVANAQLIPGAEEILLPEAIVLSPVELVHAEVRQERAFDPCAPYELSDRQRLGRRGRGGMRLGVAVLFDRERLCAHTRPFHICCFDSTATSTVFSVRWSPYPPASTLVSRIWPLSKGDTAVGELCRPCIFRPRVAFPWRKASRQPFGQRILELQAASRVKPSTPCPHRGQVDAAGRLHQSYGLGGVTDASARPGFRLQAGSAPRLAWLWLPDPGARCRAFSSARLRPAC